MASLPRYPKMIFKWVKSSSDNGEKKEPVCPRTREGEEEAVGLGVNRGGALWPCVGGTAGSI